MSLLAYLLQETGWESWRSDAACADSPLEWFFPVNPEEVTPGAALCRRCPVRRECLDFTLRQERFDVACGTWGGLNGHEIVELRRKRGRGA